MKSFFSLLRNFNPGVFGTLLGLLIVCISAIPSFAEVTSVTIHKRSSVSDAMILLGEISDIRGEDHYLNKKLGSIVIGRSPQPDRSRYIDERYIEVRLKQNKIDLASVDVRYPEKIEVYREYTRISKDRIKEIILEYLENAIPWDKDSVEIRVVNIPSDLILPQGRVTCDVTPLKHWTYMGRGSIPLIFKVNDTFKKKIWVAVEIDVFGEVVVSPKHLGKFKVVSKEDVRLEKRNLSQLPRNTVSALEEAIGKRTKRVIDANSVITADMLDIPPVVRRGDLVTLIVETDALKITTLGEVKESAIKGETIRVLNVSSQKEIYGMVVDSSTVKVKF